MLDLTYIFLQQQLTQNENFLLVNICFQIKIYSKVYESKLCKVYISFTSLIFWRYSCSLVSYYSCKMALNKTMFFDTMCKCCYAFETDSKIESRQCINSSGYPAMPYLIRPRIVSLIRSSFIILVIGSAAYNLLMICALCISVITTFETRRIRLYNVFMVI
jgi:hypothetical protein